MICPPCAEAADMDQKASQRIGSPVSLGHLPEICRDHPVQPAGCPCAHRPAGTAAPKEYARA